MKFNHRGEYDDYAMPELLKEETPETRAKRKEAIDRLNKLIEDNRKSAGRTESHE